MLSLENIPLFLSTDRLWIFRLLFKRLAGIAETDMTYDNNKNQYAMKTFENEWKLSGKEPIISVIQKQI